MASPGAWARGGDARKSRGAAKKIKTRTFSKRRLFLLAGADFNFLGLCALTRRYPHKLRGVHM